MALSHKKKRETKKRENEVKVGGSDAEAAILATLADFTVPLYLRCSA